MSKPVPPWFPGLVWSPPEPLDVIRKERHRIPVAPGVYVFTNYKQPLAANFGVLYVGKAGTSLRGRLNAYLTDPGNLMVLGRTGKISTSLKHAGKVQLITEISQKTGYYDPATHDGGLWLRWTLTSAARDLELKLIHFLNPAYNTQDKL